MSKDAIFEKNNMLSDYINKISFGEDFQKTSQEKHSTICKSDIIKILCLLMAMHSKEESTVI